MKSSRRFLPALVALSLLLSCKTVPPAPSAPRSIYIVGTTDVHGWIAGRPVPLQGAPAIRQGGLDLFASYVENLRAAHPGQVLLVDSGDLFQGTLDSNLFEGEPVVKAYNTIGYTASAIGNHEFDYGPVGPHAIVREAGENPFGALQHNIAMAHFPFLAINIREKATGRMPSWVKASTMATVAGVKVGIIGAITVDTPGTTAPANVASLDFVDPVPPVEEEARALRARGADVVILIAHIGGSCDHTENENDVSSCRLDEEGFKFASRIPPGTVDAIFGGHTHREVRHIVNGTPFLQAQALGGAFSTLELDVDTAGHHVVHHELRAHTPICSQLIQETMNCDGRAKLTRPAQLVDVVYEGKPVHPNAAVAALIAPYEEKVAGTKSRPLGFQFGGDFVSGRDQESTLGDLMADATRAAVPEAQIALLNSGGLRAPIHTGAATFGDVYSVIPFDNATAVLRLSGQELTDLLQLGTDGSHGMMQVSGLRVTLAPQAGANRVRAITLTDGTPIDPAKTYVVATSDFLAAGGDGLKPVIDRLHKDQIEIRYDQLLRDVVAEGLKKLAASGPLMPKKDGRIAVQN